MTGSAFPTRIVGAAAFRERASSNSVLTSVPIFWLAGNSSRLSGGALAIAVILPSAMGILIISTTAQNLALWATINECVSPVLFLHHIGADPAVYLRTPAASQDLLSHVTTASRRIHFDTYQLMHARVFCESENI